MKKTLLLFCPECSKVYNIKELPQYKVEDPKFDKSGESMIGYICPGCKHTSFLVFLSNNEEKVEGQEDDEEFNGEEDLYEEWEQEQEKDTDENDTEGDLE